MATTPEAASGQGFFTVGGQAVLTPRGPAPEQPALVSRQAGSPDGSFLVDGMADMTVIHGRKSEKPKAESPDRRQQENKDVDGVLISSVLSRQRVVSIISRDRDPRRPTLGGRVRVTLSDPFVPRNAEDQHTYREDEQQDGQSRGDPKDAPTYREDEGDVEFAVPAGARGRRVSRAEVEQRLNLKKWARVEINLQPSRDPRETGRQLPDPDGLSVEKDILSWFNGPFAIVTSSRQMDEGEIDKRIEDAARTADHAQQQQHDTKSAGTAKKYEHLQEQLDSGKTQGLFDTTLVVGADDEVALQNLCSRLKGLLGTNPSVSVKVHQQVYDKAEDAAKAVSIITEPKERNGIIRDVLRQLIPDRPENEMRGIRVVNREPHALQIPNWEKIPEAKRMYLGLIEDEKGREGEPIAIDSDSTEKGAGVFGGTGSGKTKLMEAYTVQYVLTEGRFGERKPAIFVNPKRLQPGEQGVAQDLANALEPHGFTVNKIKLGSLDDLPAGWNPLDPAGTPLSDYAPRLVALLTKSFGMGASNVDGLATETIERFMSRAIMGDRDFDGIYKRFGWDIETNEPVVPGSNPALPTMYDLIDVIEEAALAQEYAQGTEAANVVAWIKSIQMRKATGKAKTFYDGDALDIRKLFEVKTNAQGQPVAAVTEIDISEAEEGEKALLMGLIAMRVEDYLTRNQAEGLLVLDEANRLLSGDGELAERLAAITTTIRASHGSLLYGAQSPRGLHRDILANLQHKFGMYLQESENIQAFHGLMTMMSQEQIAEMSKYDTAEVVYAGRGMETVRGRVTDLSPWVNRDNPADNCSVGGPENLTIDGEKEFSFTTRERLKLDKKFAKGEEGRALTLLSETITLNRLFGFDRQVGLNDQWMRENGVTFFDKVRELRPDEQEYLIKRAAELSVIALSEYFNKLADLPDGRARTLDQVINRVRNEMRVALSGDQSAVDDSFDPEFSVPGFNRSANAFITLHVLLEQNRRIAEQGKFNTNQEMIDFQHSLPPHPDQEQLTMLNGGIPLEGDTAMKQLGNIKVAPEGNYAIFMVNNPYGEGTIFDRIVGTPLAKAIKRGEKPQKDWRFGYDRASQTIRASNASGEYIFNELNAAMEQKAAEVRSSQQGMQGLVDSIKALAQSGGGSNEETIQRLTQLAEQQGQMMMMLAAQFQMMQQTRRLPEGPIVDVSVQSVQDGPGSGRLESGATIADFGKERTMQFIKELDPEAMGSLARAMADRELQEISMDFDTIGIRVIDSEDKLIPKALVSAQILYMIKTLRGEEFDSQEAVMLCLTREDVTRHLNAGSDTQVDVDTELENARASFASDLARYIDSGIIKVKAYEDKRNLLAAIKMASSPTISLNEVFQNPDLYYSAIRSTYKDINAFIREEMNFDEYFGSNGDYSRSYVQAFAGEDLEGEAAIQRALTLRHIVIDARVRRLYGNEAVDALPIHLKNWLTRNEDQPLQETSSLGAYEVARKFMELAEPKRIEDFSSRMNSIFENTEISHKERLMLMVDLYSEFMDISAEFRFPTVTESTPGEPPTNRLREYLDSYQKDSGRFRGVKDRLAMEAVLIKARLMIEERKFDDAARVVEDLKKAGDLLNEFFVSTDSDNRTDYIQAYYAEGGRIIDEYSLSAAGVIKFQEGTNADTLAVRRISGIGAMQIDVAEIESDLALGDE